MEVLSTIAEIIRDLLIFVAVMTGMLVVLSPDRDALKQVAALIREAIADPELLKRAIEKADPDLMG